MTELNSTQLIALVRFISFRPCTKSELNIIRGYLVTDVALANLRRIFISYWFKRELTLKSNGKTAIIKRPKNKLTLLLALFDARVQDLNLSKSQTTISPRKPKNRSTFYFPVA